MAVKNLPSPENLTRFALVLYYQAWIRVIDTIDDFQINFDGGEECWPFEWEDYLKASQKEFETIANLAAQSAELGLKGRLCATSPFLLLLGHDGSFKATSTSLDFSELRTIDAIDLPGAVNTFCADAVSDKFIQKFNHLRKLRNKVVHLGESSVEFSLEEIVDTLITIFSELWPERSWLGEWVQSISSGRKAFFHDGRYASPQAEIFEKLPTTIDILKKSQFKKIFKINKSMRRYHCFKCYDDARMKWSDWGADELLMTAYLNEAGDNLLCLMCDGQFPIVRKACPQEDCSGNVLSADESAHELGRCHTCCE